MNWERYEKEYGLPPARSTLREDPNTSSNKLRWGVEPDWIFAFGEHPRERRLSASLENWAAAPSVPLAVVWNRVFIV